MNSKQAPGNHTQHWLAQGLLLFKKAQQAYDNNEFEIALHACQQAIPYLKSAQSPELADTYYMLANMYAEVGSLKIATDAFNAAIKAFREQDRSIELVNVYVSYGSLFEEYSRPQLAEKWLRKAYGLACDIADSEAIAMTAMLLGMHYHHQHDTAQSVNFFEHATRLTQSLENFSMLYELAMQRSAIAMVDDDYATAHHVLNDVQTHRASFDPVEQAQIDYQLARLFSIQGQVSEALEAAQRGLDTLKNVEEPEIKAGFVNFIALLLIDQGDYQEAQQMVDTAIAIAMEINNLPIQAEALSYQCLIMLYTMPDDLTTCVTEMQTFADQHAMDTIWLANTLMLAAHLVKTQQSELAARYLDEAQIYAESRQLTQTYDDFTNQLNDRYILGW